MYMNIAIKISIFIELLQYNEHMSNIKIEVIQGGLGFEKHPLKLPPILHETPNATRIKHMNGTISMARIEPGSAS